MDKQYINYRVGGLLKGRRFVSSFTIESYEKAMMFLNANNFDTIWGVKSDGTRKLLLKRDA